MKNYSRFEHFSITVQSHLFCLSGLRFTKSLPRKQSMKNDFSTLFLEFFLGTVLVFTILAHYCTCIRVLKGLYMYLIWSYTCKLLIHIYKYTHTYIYKNEILRLHITEARGYSLLGLGKCFSHANIKLHFCTSKFLQQIQFQKAIYET